MKKKNFYVVWRGRNIGIYNDWESCKLQVTGVKGSKYAGFRTLEEARIAFQAGPPVYIEKIEGVRTSAETTEMHIAKPKGDVITVDAACSRNPGVMHYRGVKMENKEVLFQQGPFEDATNNVGEFLAIVHALAWLHLRGEKVDVYSDSLSAISWVRKRKIASKLHKTDKNNYIFELIERALHWLYEHPNHNQVKKWNTAEWGEIPADFGRKKSHFNKKNTLPDTVGSF